MENKICSKCGNIIEEGHTFCVKCGQKTDIDTPQGLRSAIQEYKEKRWDIQQRSVIAVYVKNIPMNCSAN